MTKKRTYCHLAKLIVPDEFYFDMLCGFTGMGRYSFHLKDVDCPKCKKLVKDSPEVANDRS